MPTKITPAYMKTIMYDNEAVPNRLLIDLTNPFDTATLVFNEPRFNACAEAAIAKSIIVIAGYPYQEYSVDIETVRSFVMYYLYRDIDPAGRITKGYRDDGLFNGNRSKEFRTNLFSKSLETSERVFTNESQQSKSLPRPQTPDKPYRRQT